MKSFVIFAIVVTIIYVIYYTVIIVQVENIKSLDPLLYSHLTHQKYIRIK